MAHGAHVAEPYPHPPNGTLCRCGHHRHEHRDGVMWCTARACDCRAFGVEPTPSDAIRERLARKR